jgi:transcriptional antiterminator RfaH
MYNIDAYYPCIRVHPSNPRSRKVRPCFPGYLFVNADLDIVRTSLLKRIPGVVALVDFGSELASVPDDLVQAIRVYLEEIESARSESQGTLMPASSVMISSVAFPGFQAMFERVMPGQEDVQVNLKSLPDRALE